MLLFCDSFDSYNTAQIARKYIVTGIAPTIGSANGRFANGMVLTAGTIRNTGVPIPAVTTVIVGFGVKITDMPVASNLRLLEFREGIINHIGILLDNTGALLVNRGVLNGSPGNGTNLGISASGILGTGGFTYLEVKVVVHDTTGSVVIRANGIVVLTLTGIDTRDAGTGIINEVAFGSSGTSTTTSVACTVDDFYVCDNTGAINNDFLGDTRVQAILPDGAGNYTQLTPSAGSNFDCVNENPANDDTDFVSSITAGQKDSYTLAPIALLTATIFGVAVNLISRKEDAGPRTERSLVRSSGVDAVGAIVAPGVTYLNVQQIFELDPSAASWTVATVNAMEAGVEVVT